jgi:hypothetical protein
MDIGKSFGYVFEDPDWITKVLVGSLIVLISIVLSPILVGLLGFAILYGYGLEVLGNVRRGETVPLPAWQDRWGEWLILGLKLLVATFVWGLPIIVFSVFMTIGGALTDSQGGEVIGGLLLACFGCLMALWTILLLVVTPGIYVRLADTERLSSALQFADIIAFTRDNLGDVLIAVIVYAVASTIIALVAGLVGALLCLVGLIVTIPVATFYTTLVQSHLYAQVGMGGLSDLGRTDLTPAEASEIVSS